jgi:hypothetical protein
MTKWNTDDMLLDSAPFSEGTSNAVFYGIDWGRKDWSALSCPKCQQPHRWRMRRPKTCRHCGVKFVFTAADAPQRL